MNQKLYTRQEVSTYFNVSIYTIDNWIKSKQLNCHKMKGTVRISQNDIDNFLDSTNLNNNIKNEKND
jgi:excisionase family DNA binding protein